ncbi:periplasmic chaperone for outer membrane proteins Skp [Winogradskyella wandonensis]|uniref:Periplasmic chaperone for outer membrane proteins Skp n=1 Tax=Winogradskyella wandonensis TaxID=1442586 RepID=A0A4R1KTF5_9FLAO|nr:OmpH family outer membrane protein [Winogradskyella wandonensis]TCK67827.1 periplasmic chaperone for outer membrane proteins Skp [Winogradskyella wandonensis]
MKNIFRVLGLALLLSSCQEQLKVGYINNGDVIDGYQMKKDIEETYKARNEAFTKRMDSIDREFQVEVKAFQLASGKMSQKKAQEKYNELGQKNQQLTQQFQADQQILQSGYNKEMDSVIKKVNAFVRDYGKTNGYDFILGQNEVGSSVIFGKEASNLTKTITDALNTEYKNKDKEEAEK